MGRRDIDERRDGRHLAQILAFLVAEVKLPPSRDISHFIPASG
jgi:hypothetical protein